jgi:hypothetical protein
MNLIKIFDTTCDICSMLAGIDETIAADNGLFFRKIELKELAAKPSHIKDYIIPMYVEPNDGMVDIPIYIIETPNKEIQASGVIKSAEELNNLIDAFRKWESSRVKS